MKGGSKMKQSRLSITDQRTGSCVMKASSVVGDGQFILREGLRPQPQ